MQHVADGPLGASRPLKGLRVVELASVLAGPLVGTFFSELGAEVIKVEHPGTGGDVTRQWRTAGEKSDGPSAYYAAANGPKAVKLLDLMNPDDREVLDVLLRDTDILIQNFKPSSLAKLRLEPAGLAIRHPRLIHIHLMGFLNEPDRAGYDMVVQAETGFMALNGEPGNAPFRMPVALMDVLAAHQMRSAALLALWERERDGLGSHLEVWLDASGLSALANRATEYLVNGEDPAPLGALHPQIAPYGEAFECACGQQLVLSVGNDRQFRGLCTLLDLPELSGDIRFRDNPSRVRHRAALAVQLAPAFGRLQADLIMERAAETGVPMGRLKGVAAALEDETGHSMTHHFDLEGHGVRNVRQVAFRIQRNGNLIT